MLPVRHFLALIPLAICVFAACLPLVQAAHACELSSSTLTARYAVTIDDGTEHTLVLTRDNNHSVHQRPDAHIADLWRWLRDGNISHTRYLEQIGRGAILSTQTRDWSAKYQLLSDQALAQLTLVERTGEGCQRLEKYHRSLNPGTLTVWWNPDLKLLVLLDRRKPEANTTMKLVDFDTDPTTVRANIERVRALPTSKLDTVRREADFAQTLFDSLQPH